MQLKSQIFLPCEREERWEERERRERKVVDSLLKHWLCKLLNINRKKMRFVNVLKCGSGQHCLTVTYTNYCLDPEKLGLFSLIVVRNTEIILTKQWQRRSYAEIKSNLDNHNFSSYFPLQMQTSRAHLQTSNLLVTSIWWHFLITVIDIKQFL